MAIQLTINGKPQSVDVPPNMPLLWVLRDTLGMTPISSVAGKKVTTIEGLSANRSHPVQRAWIEVDVPQCGYCQSGQIMSAASLLAQNPKPSDSDIDAAMKGNICRCGTYQRIREAVHRAAALHTASAAPSRFDGAGGVQDAAEERTVEVGGAA